MKFTAKFPWSSHESPKIKNETTTEPDLEENDFSGSIIDNNMRTINKSIIIEDGNNNTFSYQGMQTSHNVYKLIIKSDYLDYAINSTFTFWGNPIYCGYIGILPFLGCLLSISWVSFLSICGNGGKSKGRFANQYH